MSRPSQLTRLVEPAVSFECRKEKLPNSAPDYRPRSLFFRELLRAVLLRPRDEESGDGLAELLARLVVHLEVNAGPDARVPGLAAYGADELGTRGEEVGQHLRTRGREGRVVRRIAREVR